MARIDTLTNFLTDVAESIRQKSETTEQIPASEFDTRIANLPSGGSAVIYQPTRISFGLYYYPFNDDGSYYDMSNEINGLDTSKVKSFANTFSNITGVPKVNLSSWNTSSCEDFTYMFEQSDFEYIDVSNFTFESAQMLGDFINNCYNLTTLILGEGWLSIDEWQLEDPEGLTPGGNIAIVPLIEGTPINDGNGYIYVPDDKVEDFKSHIVFSDYADQILPKSQIPTE